MKETNNELIKKEMEELIENPFKEEICVECGKVFIPAVEHIFNEIRKGKVYHICGYNCNLAFNRKNPKVKWGRKKK